MHTGFPASGLDDHLVETPSPKGANRLRSRLGSKDNELRGETEGLGSSRPILKEDEHVSQELKEGNWP